MAAGDVKTAITTNNGKRGASFDGVDDIITIPIIPHLNVCSAISICFNVFLELPPTDKEIFKFRNTEGFNMYYKNTGVSYTYFQTSGKGWGTIGETAITPNEWVNIIITFTSGSIKLYINGVLSDTDTTFTGTITNIGINYLGSGSTLKQNISDFQIFNKVLSQTEVTKVSNGENVTDGLIHRWKLQDDYNDSVGTNHGTNSGTFFSIQDDDVASVIKANRTTANDKYLICGLPGGQVLSGVVEEA